MLEKIDLSNCKVLDTIDLGTDGFSTGFNMIEGTSNAVITDIKKNMFTLVDLGKGKVIKTYALNIPMKNVVITKKVKLFD